MCIRDRTHLLEDGVQHHGGTGHVAAVLQQGDQEEHDHDPVSYTHLDVYKRQGNEGFVLAQGGGGRHGGGFQS